MTSAADKWLAGDTTYQQQLANFNKSKSDYNTQYNQQKSQTQQQYNNDTRDLNLQGQQDRTDQQNDYAGRGILRSGVFAKALANYNTQFNNQMSELTQGETNSVGQLDTDRTNFLRQLQLQVDAAKQDALRRRAAQLGVVS
jgi:hypothetical protein